MILWGLRPKEYTHKSPIGQIASYPFTAPLVILFTRYHYLINPAVAMQLNHNIPWNKGPGAVSGALSKKIP